MMARHSCVVLALLLLLVEVSRFGEGASNPGFVARITRTGLDYARQYGVATLTRELSTMSLPDFSGKFKAGLLGNVHYDFYRLRLQHFDIRNLDLSLLPGHGLKATLSNNLSVSGKWKVKKGIVKLEGTFDLRVDGIFISVSLNLGKNPSGRPTASMTHCNSSIHHVDIDISGNLSWILNLFNEKIANKFKAIMQQKICKYVEESITSHLNPYLQTLPVTLMIDEVAGIDYSLIDAPQVTSQGLDTPFKGEFFSRSRRSPVPFDAPAMEIPQEHDRMVYFAVSEYVFNTASLMYHQAGRMNFTLREEHIEQLRNQSTISRLRGQLSNPSCQTSKSTSLLRVLSCFSSSSLLILLQTPLDSMLHLHTNSFRAVVPRLARLYPNMKMELEGSPESAPVLMFSPGNVNFMPVVTIQAFVLLPNSLERKPLFQLRASTNVSATINVASSRITGSVNPGSQLKLELKHSNVGHFNVQLMEAFFNYYATHTIYPILNAKLEKGFPLPLPRDTFLNSLVLQIHKNFLLLGANID
ncbi:lipopolysaccharide-binding protein-like [Echinops telfairi]|uniref:Lipopolysaccharide-binding protein-like n=1 Tax=Echinops telfairi TaxID=9371 RepID=A0AC55DI69_ECHTE|nr:lipopolysaccharide-binding protein-like [Echinops telfairi]